MTIGTGFVLIDLHDWDGDGGRGRDRDRVRVRGWGWVLELLCAEVICLAYCR
ncbi:MAG: hypothetical protein BWX66_01592 [Deltaproteobacteria bacterium ADurb.Bin058]|nr:MAG: hypothetical protein BWX66_01592 [Deltaproteobacteria bacterium ADurb.Bin058]